MEEWGVMIGCLGFTTLVIMPFIVNKIIKYKLEIARINAETTLQTERIRCRNQLELEKYLKQEEEKQIEESDKKTAEDKEIKPAAGNPAGDELLQRPNRSRVRQ